MFPLFAELSDFGRFNVFYGVNGAGKTSLAQALEIWFRDKAQPDTVVATYSGLIQRNGDVVDVSGDTIIYIPLISPDNYFVAMRHRNHLGVMTENTIYLPQDNPSLIDFTDPQTEIRGNDYAQVIVQSRRALWSGDFSGDGKIIYQGPNNDIFPLFFNVLANAQNVNGLANYVSTGYVREDFNLDGQVIFQGPGNDRSKMIFESVLKHPGNINQLANFVIHMQLP